MENFFADIGAYFKDTVFNWYFLGPGLVMVILELLDKVWGWKAPGKTYIHLVFTACLVVAMFLTWRDVYHDNQRLSTDNQAKAGELAAVRKQIDKPIVKDDSSQSVITDLRQQLNEKNIEIQELKRLKDKAEDVANRKASESATYSALLSDKRPKIKVTGISFDRSQHALIINFANIGGAVGHIEKIDHAPLFEGKPPSVFRDELGTLTKHRDIEPSIPETSFMEILEDDFRKIVTGSAFEVTWHVNYSGIRGDKYEYLYRARYYHKRGFFAVLDEKGN